MLRWSAVQDVTVSAEKRCCGVYAKRALHVTATVCRVRSTDSGTG